MSTLPVGTLPARAPDDVVADVLRHEFSVDAAHCVLGNMPYKIPPDTQLYLVIFDDMGPIIGRTTFLDTTVGSDTYLKEIQQQTILHAIRVELFGFIDDQGYDVAKETAGFVAGALNGLYAQQLQGQYRMAIGQAQTPINASDTEETRRLVRYVVRVNVSVLHQRAVTPPVGADYYNKFNGGTQPVDPDTLSTMPPPSITVNP